MDDWKPQGYPSLSPYLICRDALAEIAFLQKVFGAGLLRRFDRPDGSLMHAELRLGDSVVMLGGSAPGFDPAKPHLHLYVPDVAAVWGRAMAAGAVAVQPPDRKPGDDLRGGFADPEGATWWIASQ